MIMMSNPISIKRLLIANRGEIAVRIAATCEKLGIYSIGVYSEADRRALHVNEVDESVLLGPAEARLSYLSIEKIIDAAKRSNADAVHPGYGFLSENAAFAQAVIDAGLIWVGPRPDAIESMGSKVHARQIAAKLGVPLVPGYDGEDQSAENLIAEAEKLGYPIMLKASAGGGGRGIRIVREAGELASELKQAQQEALAAFGDDRILLERYVENPRHVEVQVIGDTHGNLAHLFTRDCSVQRRHQKIIEEAPAPGISDATLEKMHSAALTLAGEMNYDNAGTVELLYEEATDSFFFLEMNTRLQVEHPVTEMITGLDLVELQIRSAAGETLPENLSDIEINGSAIEARICAEDPGKDFQPDSGMVYECELGGGDLRVDTGIEAGREVSPFYDSMISKVISYAATRDVAVESLLRGLQRQSIVGVETNTEYLAAILSTDAFQSAQLSTHFLDTHLGDWQPASNHHQELCAIAAALSISHLEDEREETGLDTPWDTLGAWRLTLPEGSTPVVFDVESERHEFRVGGCDGAYTVRSSETELSILVIDWGEDFTGAIQYSIEIDGVRKSALVSFEGDRVLCSVGTDWLWMRRVPLDEQYVSEAHQSAAAEDAVVSPCPGQITEVPVSVGDTVSEGDALVVMEAMKMIHHITSPRAGVVKNVNCTPEQSVESGVVLIELEPIEPGDVDA